MDVLLKSPDGQTIVVPAPSWDASSLVPCGYDYNNDFLDAILCRLLWVNKNKSNSQHHQVPRTVTIQRLKQQVYLVHGGKVLSETRLRQLLLPQQQQQQQQPFQNWSCQAAAFDRVSSTSTTTTNNSLLFLQMRFRICGGTDRQN
jgi:hypothetical protein